jgi:hypothetical protein
MNLFSFVGFIVFVSVLADVIIKMKLKKILSVADKIRYVSIG